MQIAAHNIHTHVSRAENIVIVPHQNPDGDAIGSAVAFHRYLTRLGKQVTIFCVTPASEKLQFITRHINLTTDPATITNPKIDTIVVLDSGDLRYAGLAPLITKSRATIINIDHHHTNEQFGHHNLVVPTASSTCEVLYHYFYHNHVAVDNHMATALLIGLTTDTGNFTNSATSATALKIGGQLVRSGGNLKSVYDGTTRNKSVSILKLWGIALERLQKIPERNITYTYITQNDLTACGVDDHETEGVSNYLNNLEDTNMTLVLKELPNKEVKGSLRTTKDIIDVSAIAKAMGGGGHKKAAGFTAPGTVDEVLERVLTLANGSAKITA